MTELELVRTAARTLDEKKAMDLQVLEIGDLTIVADYFILATATSTTHVKSLADDVEFALSQQGVEPNHIEGRATGWIVLDYDTVVVHVFLKESRDYYNLERLWTDAHVLSIEEVLGEEAK